MRIEILKSQREQFEKACITFSVPFEIYTNEKGPDWLIVMLPELSNKDAWDLCIMFQVEIKEQIIRDLV